MGFSFIKQLHADKYAKGLNGIAHNLYVCFVHYQITKQYYEWVFRDYKGIY